MNTQKLSEHELDTAILNGLETTLPVGFCIIGKDYKILRANFQLSKVSGKSLPELIGLTVAEGAPELWVYLESLYERAFEGEIIRNFEISGVMPPASGQIQSWIVNIFPIYSENNVVAIGNLIQNISDRKLAESVLEASYVQLINVISNIGEVRDLYTAGHQKRVAALAEAIAIELGLPKHEVEGIVVAARLHDIGKIAISTSLLTMPRSLTIQEMALMQTHVQSGYNIVKEVKFPWSNEERPIAEMILQHHERIDGSGYPNGLVGSNILIGAKIIAVADVVEAASSHRPYRPALGIDAALQIIEDGKGVLFDENVVAVCINLFRGKGFTFTASDFNI